MELDAYMYSHKAAKVTAANSPQVRSTATAS